MAIGTTSASAGMNETRRQRLERLWSMLDQEAQSFMPHWQDLCQYIMPRRGRFYLSDTNRGERRNQKIIDSTATMAARTLRSGMHAGMTSPARPWMRITIPDPDLAEFAPVKNWLHIVTQRMLEVFLKSNMYNALPTIYGDEATFGTAACMLMEDEETVIRLYPFPVGSYRLSQGDTGRVDTFMREYRMTVRQVVQRFGRYRPRSGSPDWSGISSTIKNLWDQGNLEAWLDVMHCVAPNEYYDPRLSARTKFKAFMSVYFEKGSNEKQFLRESGFDRFPILAPRWDLAAEDIYGTACPGMDALGDIRAIQLMHKRKAQAVEKKVNPPMTAPTSLRNSRPSILPGDTTYVDVREGQQGFKPAHTVDLQLNDLKEDIRDYQYRISRAYYEDLFLMLTMSDRREITAREVEERHEEKLLMLGPTLERNDSELYKPAIDLTFPIMVARGMIPPAPQEIENTELRVEYLSIMAQAQKMIGLGSIERFGTFVAALGEVNPEVFDKVNTDEMVDEYHDRMGLPPRLIRTDDQAEAIRARRAQQQAQQAQAAAMKDAAAAVNSLSKADTEGDNVLTGLARNTDQELLPL